LPDIGIGPWYGGGAQGESGTLKRIAEAGVSSKDTGWGKGATRCGPTCKASSGFSGGLWPMFLIMNIGHSEMQKEMASMAGSITKGKSKQLKAKPGKRSAN